MLSERSSATHFRFARHDVAALGVGGANLLHALGTSRQRVRRLGHKSVYCLTVTCATSEVKWKKKKNRTTCKMTTDKRGEGGDESRWLLSSIADMQPETHLYCFLVCAKVTQVTAFHANTLSGSASVLCVCTLDGLFQRHQQQVKEPLDEVVDGALHWLTVDCNAVDLLLT